MSPWIRPPWIRRPWIRPPWIRPPWIRPPWIRPPWNRPSAREATLRKRRERDRDRSTRESSEQRGSRLSTRRLADRERAGARGGSETATQREVRLARGRIADRSRRVSQSQSTEEREARLHQLRVTQQQSIATEGERPVFSRLGARRIGESLLNQQRIATETSEEIEARRARDRRNHMDLKTAEVPLFQQTCVRFEMRQVSVFLGVSQKCKESFTVQHST